MRIFKLLFFFVITIVLFQKHAIAQELKIFGFGQAYHRTQLVSEGTLYQKIGLAKRELGTTFNVQQFNLMMSSDFGGGYGAFANIEILSNYDQLKKFGNISLQEMFLKYQNNSGTFNVKFGAFLPKFNNFLEMYNRFPLMPFIMRPILYETDYWTFFNIDDFAPIKSNVQIYGEIPLSEDISFDYAVFHGNPEFSILSTAGPSTGVGGKNETTIMQYGGRVGLNLKTENFGSLTVGGSISLDKDNQKAASFMSPAYGVKNFGTIDRQRFGADIKYNFKNLTINAELVVVSNSLTSQQADSLNWFKTYHPVVKNSSFKNDLSFDKSFYYVSAEYYFLEDASVFGFISSAKDQWNLILQSGIDQISFGATWSPISNVVLKGQWQQIKLIEPNLLSATFKESTLIFGVSLMF